MVPVCMTLNDLWPRFQGYDVIKRQITRKWYNVTTADQYKVVYDLSNGAIFNDLEQPLPPVSRSRHFWSWISQKRYDFYQHTDARYWYSNSVRLSVTFRYENGSTYCHNFFTIRYVAQTIPILSASNNGHGYYRRQIGNCIRVFEWHQFKWSRVTSDPPFKVTIIFNVQ